MGGGREGGGGDADVQDMGEDRKDVGKGERVVVLSWVWMFPRHWPTTLVKYTAQIWRGEYVGAFLPDAPLAHLWQTARPPLDRNHCMFLVASLLGFLSHTTRFHRNETEVQHPLLQK